MRPGPEGHSLLGCHGNRATSQLSEVKSADDLGPERKFSPPRWRRTRRLSAASVDARVAAALAAQDIADLRRVYGPGAVRRSRPLPKPPSGPRGRRALLAQGDLAVMPRAKFNQPTDLLSEARRQQCDTVLALKSYQIEATRWSAAPIGDGRAGQAVKLDEIKGHAAYSALLRENCTEPAGPFPDDPSRPAGQDRR